MSDERFSLKVPKDAAIVPKWLIFSNRLSYGARILAQAILFHEQTGDGPPSRETLAADLDVVPRTIDRWLDELHALNLIEIVRDGRRYVFGFQTPKRSPTMTDRSTMTNLSTLDRSIYDKSVYHDKSVYVDRFVYLTDYVASGRRRRRKVDRFVDSPPVGVVGDSHDERSTPTPPNATGPCTTRLGVRLVELRISAAREFDARAAAGEIDEDYYLAELARMKQEGLRKDAIVNFLRMLPPRPLDPPADPPPSRDAPEDDQGDQQDQADDDPPEDRLLHSLRLRLRPRWYIYLQQLDLQIAGDVAQLRTSIHGTNADYRADLETAAELVLRHDVPRDPRLSGIARIEVQ